MISSSVSCPTRRHSIYPFLNFYPCVSSVPIMRPGEVGRKRKRKKKEERERPQLSGEFDTLWVTRSVYPVGPTGICPRRKLASTLRTQFTAQTADGTVLGHLSTRFMPIRAWRTTVLWAWGLVLLGLGHVGTKTVFLHCRPSPPYATAGWPFVGAGPWPSPLLLTEMLTTGMRKNARAQWRTVCIYWVQYAAVEVSDCKMNWLLIRFWLVEMFFLIIPLCEVNSLAVGMHERDFQCNTWSYMELFWNHLWASSSHTIQVFRLL